MGGILPSVHVPNRPKAPARSAYEGVWPTTCDEDDGELIEQRVRIDGKPNFLCYSCSTTKEPYASAPRADRDILL
ncbi:MAG: hypothetical protein KGR26_11140 [Cyanobacteria bacterium REEB65]|nr:hypothetical protein [Cyanobacteria bacterium REEB65]